MITGEDQFRLQGDTIDALRPDQWARMRRTFGAEAWQRPASRQLRGDRGSIVCWVRPSNDPLDGLFHFYAGIQDIEVPGSFVYLIKSDGNLMVMLFFTSLGIGGPVVAAGPLTANVWHLMAGVWNNGQASFYFDGELLAAAAVFAGLDSLPAMATIALNEPVLGLSVDAEIANPLWFSRELRPEEIAWMYRNRVGL